MISPWLLSALRCPACAPAPGTPDTRMPLQREGYSLVCAACGARYALHNGYVDMRPPAALGGKTTVYAEDDAALDDMAVRPPLLSAGVRLYALRRLLRPEAGDALLDIGCGNGKFAVWNRPLVAHLVGLDAAARFAPEALRSVDLVRGDARALPFASAAFDGAYSLDLMEHLDLAGVRAHFAETRRVLQRRGAYFCMSNTRERSPLNALIDPGRRLAERLHRAGIVDRTRDHLRKSDHVKAIATADDLAAELARAGLRPARLWFLNPVLATWVETVGLAVAERAASRKVPRSTFHVLGAKSMPQKAVPPPSQRGTRNAERGTSVRDRAAAHPAVRGALRLLTAALVADVALFRRVRTGPFFLLARPVIAGAHEETAR